MAKAAVTRSIRDDHQKNFLKIFNGLTGKHSRWEIWEDFVTLTAIEISNSTDKVNATERTKMYQTIISKYSAKERDGMAEMLAEVVMGMEQNPDQDFLGSLYMMCELGHDHAGQFFTPYDVCRCMAEITFDPKLHPDMEGFISVSDPACGAGAGLPDDAGHGRYCGVRRRPLRLLSVHHPTAHQVAGTEPRQLQKGRAARRNPFRFC